jgi:UDP-sugar pyrophosphorylase
LVVVCIDILNSSKVWHMQLLNSGNRPNTPFLSSFQVPDGERLIFGTKEFDMFERRGIEEACRSAFVLVAGGLGERLGYSGIKVTNQYLC